MIQRYSFLFVVPLLLLLSVIYAPKQFEQEIKNNAVHTVNAVIGNESFITIFGNKPDSKTDEKLRITTHLQYVQKKLRARSTKHLSPRQKKNRSHYLDLLQEYIRIGEFPHNDGHPDARRPTFIDEDGNICAVGYLVEQTEGRALAEALNKKYKYTFIPEIEDPVFRKWANESGFTIKELAMIQPTYGGYREEPEPEIETSYGLGSGLIATGNILYLTNRDQAPWMFSSAKSSHWFGLTVGTASTLLGVLNLDNKNKVTVVHCNMFGDCQDASYTQKRNWRTGVSIANIAIGLVSITRSAYHLLNDDDRNLPMISESSTTELDLTHLQTYVTPAGETVPALKFKYNF